MNVAEMMSLMRTLGIGASYEDDYSKKTALKYLNLANDEIYRETAGLNSDILTNDILNSTLGNSSVTLAQTPFLIAEVFVQGQSNSLTGMSALAFAKYQFEHSNFVGNPLIYYKKANTINFFPIQSTLTYNLSIWYAPERTVLEENTTEADIPYPLSYHSVLVDCALYYLFQDESGFRNQQKENEALRRATKTKNDLISYFKSANRQIISTFSNA